MYSGLSRTDLSRPWKEICSQRHLAPVSSPGRKLIFWALCASVLPAVVLASGSQSCSGQYFSSALDSLKCCNDYSSHIRCSWRESAQTHSQAPLSLYHLDMDENSDSKCEPYGPPDPLPGGQLEVHCQYNTTLFSIGTKDGFFFQTPHSPGLFRNLSVPVLVRVRPPHGLSQRALEGGGRLLRWNSSYLPGSPLYPTLNYEVNYRRLGQEWTVVEVSVEEAIIQSDSMVPGCRYEARVRGRGGQGLWSHWSPLVEWKTKEVSVLGPYNLQCDFDGEATMRCSWELKTDLAQFVTYNLFYRTDPTAAAQPCCSDAPLSVDSSLSVLRRSCSFSVSRPDQLQVELTPSYNTRRIQSHRNIRPATPGPVELQEKGRDWVLSWTPPQSRYPVSFQVGYWRSDAPKEVIYCNVSEGSSSQRFHGSSLLPSTGYSAQVRALVPPSRRSLYAGSPSDWTQPVHWRTRSAPRSLSTVLLLAMGVCLAVLFVCFSFPACRRGAKAWEMSVPSPFKSQVLVLLRKESTNNSLAYQNEFERAPVSKIKVLENVQAAEYGPRASEESCERLRLTAAEEDGPYQQDSRLGPRDGAMTHAICLHFPGLEPQSEGAVTWPNKQDGASHSSLPTSQGTLLQCGTEYVEVPSAIIGSSLDASPKWFKGELAEQDMCIHNSSPLVGPPKSETGQPSAPEPLGLDPYAYMPIPFNIHSVMVRQNLDCCTFPDIGTSKGGTASLCVPPAGSRARDLAGSRQGWLEDMKDDYTYVKLSQI